MIKMKCLVNENYNEKNVLNSDIKIMTKIGDDITASDHSENDLR